MQLVLAEQGRVQCLFAKLPIDATKSIAQSKAAVSIAVARYCRVLTK